MFLKFIKRFFLLVFLILAIVVLGGIGGLVLDAYIPTLTSFSGFGRLDVFKKLTERVTIINKTEQVIMREDDSVERIVSQPATAVVTIVVLPDALKGASQESVTTLTGVLLTNDGLITTYSEGVLGKAGSQYTVLLFDGTRHPADFVAHDSFTNLSYLRLSDGTNTPAIAFANSDDARVGKKLIAISNASLAYQNRLSVGILGSIDYTFNLSGKTVSSSEKLEGVFGMDFYTAENFIGGPAVGFNGEMVGVIGKVSVDNVVRTFLIPSNVVRESFERAVSGTLGKRPIFGAYYLPITKALSIELGLARDRGALIYSPSGKTGLALLADSKALKAGLQAGDIIISLDGQEITPDTPFSLLLGYLNTGDTIELYILRNGEEKKIPLTL